MSLLRAGKDYGCFHEVRSLVTHEPWGGKFCFSYPVIHTDPPVIRLDSFWNRQPLNKQTRTHIYRYPPNIRWAGRFRTTPIALAKWMGQMSWNLAGMLLWAKLEQASRRFLISALKAPKWGTPGGSIWGQIFSKKFMPPKSVFLVVSAVFRCFTTKTSKTDAIFSLFPVFRVDCSQLFKFFLT